MKLVVAIAMAVGVAFASQGSARESEGLTVRAAPLTVTSWVHRVTGELSDNIRFPAEIGRDQSKTGFVSVRFACGPDGKPYNLTVVHRADRRLDLQAIRAVNALRSLHPLPAGVDPGRTMQANVIFADNAEDLQRQTRLLQHAEAARMTSSPAEHDVLAFNSGSTGPG